jgi:hypothetical protein
MRTIIFVLACLAGACSATSTDGPGSSSDGNGDGNDAGPSSSSTGSPGSPDATADPPQDRDGGIGTDASDASKPDSYVPPGGVGVTITIDGTTYHDATTTIRRNTVVGGGPSDGTSYISGTLGGTPADTLFTLKINSQSDYVTPGDYPCGSARSPSSGHSFVEVAFLGQPSGKIWDSTPGTCMVHVATVSASLKPHVTGTIIGSLQQGGVTADAVGTFDLAYSN